MDDKFYRIKGLNGYLVNKQGDILSLKKRILLKHRIDSGGYHMAYIHKKNIWVHRIVAETFLPNPNNYKYVNHINEDKSDNRVENLEWCTNSYNNLHRRKNNKRLPKEMVKFVKYNKLRPCEIVRFFKERGIEVNNKTARYIWHGRRYGDI